MSPVRRWAAAGLLACALASAVSSAVAAAAPPLSGPYQDVSQGLDPAAPLLRPLPWVAPGQVLVWAFATGNCRSPRWAEGLDAAASRRFERDSVRAFVREGRGYIVSTGGEAGGFTCDRPEDLAAFVRRIDSPQLRGLDFDIERNQTPQQIGALVRGAAVLKRQRPQLRISFTLATHASSDGSGRHLNATGLQVMAALVAARFDTAVINLMVMNYGEPDARWCVPAPGATPPRCDMGASALQAAKLLHEGQGWPYARIALTPMLGENDVAANAFSLADARTLVLGAQALGLAGVHWWSAGRDRPCRGEFAGEPRVSPRCHAMAGEAEAAPGAYGQVLGRPLR